MTSPTIYLDYAASTPVDPRVAAVMTDCLSSPGAQGNPASATHGPGLAAQARVESARAEVAALIGAEAREIIFTSGATESNNLALLGVARAARRAAGAHPGRTEARAHMISARTEHKSVLDALKQLEKEGVDVTLVEPDESGRVPPEAIEVALRPDTLLVSLMLANNEIGVVNDVARVAALVAARGVLTHTDASQAVGKMPVDVTALGIDLLSFTAHKFHGPKGIGALYVREEARPRIAPVQFGGGHERGLRSGTLPTHQVAGFGCAAALARAQGVADAAHARDLAMRLERELLTIPGASFNHRADGVPGLLNVSYEGVEGESLVTGLPEIAVSTGSACSSATREASYVLRALGRSTELAQSSLRISLGRFSTVEEVDAAATAIRGEVSRLRVLAGNGAVEGAAERRLDPESALATGNSLLGMSLAPAARRYFLAPPRPVQFAEGAAPADVRHGRAGRRSDGTCVLFELKIAHATVKSARFSAYGCPHTLAITSWICEVLEGAPLQAGPPGSPEEWMEKFAVPAEKLGRLLIIEDALRAALGSERRAGI
jgi:cysteine desulfurase